jgi:hypothetical protein
LGPNTLLCDDAGRGRAFLAAHCEPQYLEKVQKLKVDLSPIDAGEVLQATRRIAETSSDLFAAM